MKTASNNNGCFWGADNGRWSRYDMCICDITMMKNERNVLGVV